MWLPIPSFFGAVKSHETCSEGDASVGHARLGPRVVDCLPVSVRNPSVNYRQAAAFEEGIALAVDERIVRQRQVNCVLVALLWRAEGDVLRKLGCFVPPAVVQDELLHGPLQQCFCGRRRLAAAEKLQEGFLVRCHPRLCRPGTAFSIAIQHHCQGDTISANR